VHLTEMLSLMKKNLVGACAQPVGTRETNHG
jgi:hypothetical protein